MIIYIAGPYNGSDYIGTQQNILNASKSALGCWKKGWAVICPHKNASGFEYYEQIGEIAWETWIKGDKEILSKCNAILMSEGWEKSKGANIELDIAKEMGLSVYYSLDDVPDLNEKNIKRDSIREHEDNYVGF